MLQVDLAKPDRQLSQLIAMKCSSFGIVKSVQIHRNPTPFALITMSSRSEMLELAAMYGGSCFGMCAVIHLEEESEPEKK